jgi:hypothetical protein
VAKARGRSGGRPAKLTGERAEHARNLLAAGYLPIIQQIREFLRKNY